jgi:thiamine-monophosphate kinase
MSWREIGEFGFIHRIKEGCLVRPADVVAPIGDDAAGFYPPAGAVTLLTTDLLVERVHFLRDRISGEDLGHKALAVNLSDIAAMGGTAREAFVSIAIPRSCRIDYLDGIYTGMKALAGRFSVNILGGDTTGSKGDLIINIAVTGTVAEGEMLRRSGARPGDVLCVTGPVGESRAGLHLIINDIPAEAPDRRALIEAHQRPWPHLDEGRYLARAGGVRAAIDVSDGLAADIGHILDAAGAGAEIDAGAIPVTDRLRAFCEELGLTAADYALEGGEDYVLACAVAPDRVDAVAGGFSARFGRPLHRVGRVTERTARTLVRENGERVPLSPAGWDHFRTGDDESD